MFIKFVYKSFSSSLKLTSVPSASPVDRVFEQILYSVHPYLKTVKEILQKFTQGLVTYQPEPGRQTM